MVLAQCESNKIDSEMKFKWNPDVRINMLFPASSWWWPSNKTIPLMCMTCARTFSFINTLCLCYFFLYVSFILLFHRKAFAVHPVLSFFSSLLLLLPYCFVSFYTRVCLLILLIFTTRTKFRCAQIILMLFLLIACTT